MSATSGMVLLMSAREDLAVLYDRVVSTRARQLELMVTGGPVQIRLRCHDGVLLTRLLNDLRPYLQPADAEGAEDVQVVVDAELAQQLERTVAGAAGAESGEPHVLRDGVHLVRKQIGSATDLRRGHLLWNEDDPRASWIVLDSAGDLASTLLLRLVRGIATRAMLAAGWVPLHAASALLPGGAVCLLGGHNSGKSTALLHLLAGAAGAAALIANSIVFLSPSGPVEARTVPMAMSLRPGSVDLFPAMRRLLGETSADDPSQQRIRVPARRVADAFGVGLVAGGPVVAFLDIAYGGLRPARWRELPGPARAAALQAARLPDGLVDDRHEHVRLDSRHADGHVSRLEWCAASTACALLESGTDTAQVLRPGLGRLLRQAAR
jgi:hypothetical protein